ncbi:MAG: SusF/SusE family outer membrane protein [Muribaculaceae bacterium]|nr:SusF/SusE family outer membrane protein [Muribaculaceae bacterium]MDE6486558.1 SusF/SusE family outer membrane protein [Muribaculaceae bacterium]
MKKTVIALFAACSLSAGAGNLWIIGPATSYGWSTDDATALLSTGAEPDVYTGTLYLKAGEDFKFMTVPDFGNTEIGAAPDATLVDGTIALASGTDDSGYAKLQVPESANYAITVNTAAMTATMVKSPYQDSEIGVCGLYMVGSAMPEGWDVMKGLPLYQDPERPYEYASGKVALNAGTFKIARELKGACSWDARYWYFRDADDASKVALGQDGDLQWEIADAGNYNVNVNLNTSAISIAKAAGTGIESVEADASDAPAEYYTVTGIRIPAPAAGQVCIVKRGTKVSKVLVK